jgi:hypothetical protein
VGGQGGAVGPLAVGAGAVWVGTGDGRTARVDPVGLRVTGRVDGQVAVAHGVLWSYCCLRGDNAMGLVAPMPARCGPARRCGSPTPRAGASRSGRLPLVPMRSGP